MTPLIVYNIILLFAKNHFAEKGNHKKIHPKFKTLGGRRGAPSSALIACAAAWAGASRGARRRARAGGRPRHARRRRGRPGFERMQLMFLVVDAMSLFCVCKLDKHSESPNNYRYQNSTLRDRLWYSFFPTSVLYTCPASNWIIPLPDNQQVIVRQFFKFAVQQFVLLQRSGSRKSGRWPWHLDSYGTTLPSDPPK